MHEVLGWEIEIFTRKKTRGGGIKGECVVSLPHFFIFLFFVFLFSLVVVVDSGTSSCSSSCPCHFHRLLLFFIVVVTVAALLLVFPLDAGGPELLGLVEVLLDVGELLLELAAVFFILVCFVFIDRCCPLSSCRGKGRDGESDSFFPSSSTK